MLLYYTVILLSSWGPLKNYVILLGGGGRSPKDYIRLQGGRGDTPKDYIGLQGGLSIWFNPSIDKVSKKIQMLLIINNFFELIKFKQKNYLREDAIR